MVRQCCRAEVVAVGLSATTFAGDSIMLRRALVSSRYIVFIAVVAALIASIALILYEAVFVVL